MSTENAEQIAEWNGTQGERWAALPNGCSGGFVKRDRTSSGNAELFRSPATSASAAALESPSSVLQAASALIVLSPMLRGGTLMMRVRLRLSAGLCVSRR
jgi:hypothetical protein